MSKHIERPGRDLWANVDESALSYPVPEPVTGDKRTTYPAGAPLSPDPAQVEVVEEIQEEAKATIEKPRKAKEAK